MDNGVQFKPIELRAVQVSSALSVALAGLAVLQGVVLWSAGDWPRAMMAGTAAAGTLAAWLAIRTSRLRLAVLGALGVLGAINLGTYLAGASVPFSFRLVLVAVTCGYVSIGTAGIAWLAVGLSPRHGFVAAISLTVTFVLAEALLDRYADVADGEMVWVGGTRPHPVLGEFYEPYAHVETRYPDNPRGYFEEIDPIVWMVETHDPESAASLQVSPADRSRLRVQIERANRAATYNIQLRQPHLATSARQQYRLSFRIRADSPRPLAVGLSMAHPPWEGLGFYREVTAGTEWQDVSMALTLARGDENSQLHFDLAGDSASIELDSVVLRHEPSGRIVEPPAPRHTYAVRYDMNALGCRGPDYSIPASHGRVRILVLGDSYAMGVGVHQADTFAARLERSLNADVTTAVTYDVVNCGVSGYATREERLFYESTAAKYAPDLVLLSMVYNDDLSWVDEQELGLVYRPSRVEQLFRSAFLLGRTQAERARVFDYSSSMRELIDLQRACAERGARLAVILFRTDGRPQWRDLAEAVDSTLRGTDVPVLDLGAPLLESHSPDALLVHRLDGHPNEIAHRRAAIEIETFLRSNNLIR